MRIVVGSDETGALPDAVIGALRDAEHEVTLLGPLAGGPQEWAEVGAAVGAAVADGAADLGVVCCYTGTGVSIAANKVPGVRAALCADPETARLARRYNHANVLALSLRATSVQLGREILAAFITSPYGDEAFDRRNVAALERRP